MITAPHTAARLGTRLRRAFTLVETLVAITVVTLAILAPFDAIQRVIAASRLAKDNLIASALAQEGLEYVRFVRTSNYLAGKPLFQGIDNTSSARFGRNDCVNSLCELDATQSVGSAITSCNSTNIDVCRLLYVNSSTGLYTFSTTNATPSLFKRGFTYVQYANYEKVTVKVEWSDHGTQILTLTENLYDWF